MGEMMHIYITCIAWTMRLNWLENVFMPILAGNFDL